MASPAAHLAAGCGGLTHPESEGATKPARCAVLRGMVGTPEDIEALKAALAAERAARLAAEARASGIDALVASLKLQIEKLRRELYGQRSEREGQASRSDGTRTRGARGERYRRRTRS